MTGEPHENWSGSYLDTDIDVSISGRVRVFDLAVRLEMGMSRHPHHPPYNFTMAKTHGGGPYKNGVSAAMEQFAMGAHVGTHVDALGHVSKDGMVFGCRDVLMGDEGLDGLDAGSIEETPPIIGPGHLFNGPSFFGRDLTPSDGLGPEVFESWFGDHPPLEPGSIFLVRTGWMKYWSDAERYIGLSTGLPGVTVDGAHWLSEHGIIAAGSDTMNFEHKPNSNLVDLPVHVHFLVEKGIPIMESMALEQLGAAGVTEFTFIATPLRIGGGTGSPIRPIAIVDTPR
ncbi:cyclase family protein [Cryobacterium sp. TMS1-20-1]|uniref:cyclase family protein n=1 Tax=Cryobacterium sp. TMS1-20-1 TaxID=1259223 RepID=UPI00106C849E|nr:cyclase family protein [Cryobacterium sp. TMS1-20-1]TFC80546.1 cyclase family protein [Cryobacterium sp. TMS1-20-1]